MKTDAHSHIDKQNVRKGIPEKDIIFLKIKIAILTYKARNFGVFPTIQEITDMLNYASRGSMSIYIREMIDAGDLATAPSGRGLIVPEVEYLKTARARANALGRIRDQLTGLIETKRSKESACVEMFFQSL